MATGVNVWVFFVRSPCRQQHKYGRTRALARRDEAFRWVWLHTATGLPTYSAPCVARFDIRTMMDVKVVLMAVLIPVLTEGSGQGEVREFCIIGAGPGGTQYG